jgi:hypothetical protein
MKLEFSGDILEKSSNIKFNENPASKPELFHADGQTHIMTKLIVAFRNFANAHNNQAVPAGY